MRRQNVTTLAIAAASLLWLISPLAADAPTRLRREGGPNSQSSKTGAQIDTGGVLAKYCFTCHNDKTKTGDLALDVVSRGSVRDHAPVWEDALHLSLIHI